MSVYNVHTSEWSDSENRWIRSETLTVERALEIVAKGSRKGKSVTIPELSKREARTIYLTKIENQKRDGAIPVALAQEIVKEFIDEPG